MPFGPFAKKFSPKKPVVRKASSISTLQSLDREALQRELNTNDTVNKIRINLDGNKMVFDGEGWISGTPCKLNLILSVWFTSFDHTAYSD